MKTIAHLNGRPLAVSPAVITPRPEDVAKIIAPQPDSGIPCRLDLEELLGDRLEGFAKRFWARVIRYDAYAELDASGTWRLVSDGEDGCWGWTGRIAKKSG